MVFKQYKSTVYRKELTKLLRKRLLLKDKVRYHRLKTKDIKKQIKAIEKEIESIENINDQTVCSLEGINK